jgi:cell division protein FtsZ
MKRAMEGIEELKKEVDSLIIIPNERLKVLGSKTTSFKDLIARADEVLLQAVKGISELIISNGFINLDFADIKRVMEQMGTAIMGMGSASGENRAAEAAQMAINSPLLEDISIGGARGLLMNITGPSDMTMEEIDEASNYIKEEVNQDAEIFWGVVFDDNLEDEVHITVIATGIDNGTGINSNYCTPDYSNVVKIRDITPEEAGESWTVKMNGESLDTPTYQRKGKELSTCAEEGEMSLRKRSVLNRFQLKDNLDYPTFLREKAD